MLYFFNVFPLILSPIGTPYFILSNSLSSYSSSSSSKRDSGRNLSLRSLILQIIKWIMNPGCQVRVLIFLCSVTHYILFLLDFGYCSCFNMDFCVFFFHQKVQNRYTNTLNFSWVFFYISMFLSIFISHCHWACTASIFYILLLNQFF